MFITSAELADASGYRQPAAQVRWLKRNGVRHFVRADGHPRVPRTAFDTMADAQKPPKVSAGPDLESVRRKP